MKRTVPVLALLSILLACENDQIATKNGDSQVFTRSTLFDEAQWIDGIRYPVGTTIEDASATTLEITLPAGYYFLLQEPDGDVHLAMKKCWKCECLIGQMSHCSPVVDDGGFDCDRGNNCSDCRGTEYDCIDNPAPKTRTIGIIDSLSPVHFINSLAEMDTLSNFQMGSSEADSIGNDNLYEILELDDIYADLFKPEYFEEEGTDTIIIPVSAFGNTVLLEVNEHWKDYVYVELDEEVYGELASPSPPISYVCWCDVREGPPTGSCPMVSSGYLWNRRVRCNNNCSNGCVITWEE